MIKNMKVLFVVVLALLGWVVAYQGLVFRAPLPPGQWARVFDFKGPNQTSEASRGAGTYLWSAQLLLVASDERTLYIAIPVSPTIIWNCSLPDGNCEKASSQVPFPVSPDIITITHDVNSSEIPSLPAEGPPLDTVKIVRHVADDTLTAYYVLMNDGTVWNWGYYSVEGFYAYLRRLSVGLAGFAVGIIIALAILKLNRQALRNET